MVMEFVCGGEQLDHFTSKQHNKSRINKSQVSLAISTGPSKVLLNTMASPNFTEMKYIGCICIKTSMRSLDLDTRSQVTKECILRVCEEAGLRFNNSNGNSRNDKRTKGMLEDKAKLDFSGSYVNLQITSGVINLMVRKTGEVIVRHEMPNISFASLGEAETQDFVAYVAKDHKYGRACFVLDCTGRSGLAADVISTIGQAFELRFKEFLKRNPKLRLNDDRCLMPLGSNVATSCCSSTTGHIPQAAPRNCLKTKPQVATPGGTTTHPTLESSSHPSSNLIDLNTSFDECSTGPNGAATNGPTYVNCGPEKCPSPSASTKNYSKSESGKDPFDMQPFNSIIEDHLSVPEASLLESINQKSEDDLLQDQEWFHGSISRKESEELVVEDGDFLVRESTETKGQYVLTGKHGILCKHFFLIDPQGVVRTRDQTFDSVYHMIKFHRENQEPIAFGDSDLILKNPVKSDHYVRLRKTT